MEKRVDGKLIKSKNENLLFMLTTMIPPDFNTLFISLIAFLKNSI